MDEIKVVWASVSDASGAWDTVAWPRQRQGQQGEKGARRREISATKCRGWGEVRGPRRDSCRACVPGEDLQKSTVRIGKSRAFNLYTRNTDHGRLDE